MNKFIIAAVVAVMATGVSAETLYKNVGTDTDPVYEAVADLAPSQAAVDSAAQSGLNTGDNVLGSNIGSQTNTTTVTHEDGSGTTTVNNHAIKPNGYVSNPNLTTSGADTCFGSKSGGISGPGFGISGGETVVDQNCIMLKNAKILASLGLKDAAVLLLMNSNDQIAAAVWGANPNVAEALTSVSQ